MAVMPPVEEVVLGRCGPGPIERRQMPYREVWEVENYPAGPPSKQSWKAGDTLNFESETGGAASLNPGSRSPTHMHKVFLDLPAGTVVFQHRAGVTFTFSWQSTEGMHIVRSKTPVDWNDSSGALEKIGGAVRDFTLAVALEVLNGYSAQRESER